MSVAADLQPEVRTTVAAGVERRALPYPYRAMLAICSDLDETPDGETYLETTRFLNTTGPTRYGDGVGLEVGNTIYFDMPPDQFAYWNTDDHHRAAVRTLIASGHIDCIHSFGDLAATRAHAARALDELDRQGCRPEVWIDHALARTNFGADIMHGEGDVANSPAYHADLTWAFGVRYVWRGRVTSITGQGVPGHLAGIFDARHAAASARTLTKEAAKGLVARTGNTRYRMHGSNAVGVDSTLRSGQRVYEFLRSNPHWGGVSSCETAAGIGDVLTSAMLDRLVDRGGVCILYTHLGKMATRANPFTADGIRALRRLAKYDRDGRIVVTTTRRVVGYWRAMTSLTWTTTRNGDGVLIDVRTKGDYGSRHDLEGLTFYVGDPERTTVSVNGVGVNLLRHNPADHTGQRSVSLPRTRLEFPSI